MRKWPILLLAGLVLGSAACAEDDGIDDEFPQTTEEEGQIEQPMGELDDPMEESMEARELVNDVLTTTDKMKEDPDLWSRAQQARGIFVVPHFGQAAAGVGARGGEGVLLTQTDAGWAGPAFYDVGGVSVGAQLGASGGEIALLLMTDEAVDGFREENNFALNADAGLVLLDYSAVGQATTDGDVILWSDTEGAFAGVALGMTDINFDEEENRAYYGQTVTADAILDGTVTGPQSGLLKSRIGG